MEADRPGTTWLARVVGALVFIWCLIPLAAVLGFFAWATVTASLPWNLVFGTILLLLIAGLTRWARGVLRQRRETGDG